MRPSASSSACQTGRYELKNGHRLVSYVSSDTGRAFPFRFERDGSKTEIKVDHRVGINESNAHLAACVAGLGIVQTFGYAAASALRDGAVVEILQEWRPARYPFQLVYPQARHVPHRLRVFMDWLLEAFPQQVADCPDSRPGTVAAKSRRQ